CDDAFTQLVARPREGEREVGVQAFETAGPGTRAADAEVELRSQPPLFLVGALEARSELRILAGRTRPALDAARGLESRDLCDQVRAGQPVRRRKRFAAVVVRRLFGHRGAAERAADGDAQECARRAP